MDTQANTPQHISQVQFPDISPKMTTTTLRELGPQLPCGIVANGQLSKTFRVRPFRMKEEKLIGAMKEKRHQSYGEFTSAVLAQMIATVGQHSFDGMKESERRLVLTNMLQGDVLYMFLYLRYATLGDDEPVMMNAICPHCRAQERQACDLGSLEVRTLPATAIDLRRRVTIRDGLNFRGIDSKVLTLHPVRWNAMEQAGMAGVNAGEREALVLLASIVGIEGDTTNPFVMASSELDEMTKYDLEGLTADIEDNNPGPVMTVELTCPKCKLEFKNMIDWHYDSFFARSSQRIHGRS